MNADQKFFNETLAAYLTRGEKPGWNKEFEMCAYETPEGDRCAIGRKIPDGHPALKFQGTAFTLFTTQEFEGLQEQILPGVSDSVIKQVQEAHDYAARDALDNGRDGSKFQQIFAYNMKKTTEFWLEGVVKFPKRYEKFISKEGRKYFAPI